MALGGAPKNAQHFPIHAEVMAVGGAMVYEV